MPADDTSEPPKKFSELVVMRTNYHPQGRAISKTPTGTVTFIYDHQEYEGVTITDPTRLRSDKDGRRKVVNGLMDKSMEDEDEIAELDTEIAKVRKRLDKARNELDKLQGSRSKAERHLRLVQHVLRVLAGNPDVRY